MQAAVTEYARNVCGIEDADSADWEPDCTIRPTERDRLRVRTPHPARVRVFQECGYVGSTV